MTNNVGPKHKKWTIFDPCMHLVQVKFALGGVVGTLCENAGEPRGSMQPFSTFQLKASVSEFGSWCRGSHAWVGPIISTLWPQFDAIRVWGL